MDRRRENAFGAPVRTCGSFEQWGDRPGDTTTIAQALPEAPINAKMVNSRAAEGEALWGLANVQDSVDALAARGNSQFLSQNM